MKINATSSPGDVDLEGTPVLSGYRRCPHSLETKGDRRLAHKRREAGGEKEHIKHYPEMEGSSKARDAMASM